MNEILHHILTSEFFITSILCMVLATYFKITNTSKLNGFGKHITNMFFANAVLWFSFGIVTLFELRIPLIGVIVMLPYMFYKYRFGQYVFNQLK